MKYSPAPWIVKSPENDSNVFDVYSANNVLLHRGYWGHMADSKLIAAAPELFQALQMIAVESEYTVTDPINRLKELRDLALNAIAKAERK